MLPGSCRRSALGFFRQHRDFAECIPGETSKPHLTLVLAAMPARMDKATVRLGTPTASVHHDLGWSCAAAPANELLKASPGLGGWPGLAPGSHGRPFG